VTATELPDRLRLVVLFGGRSAEHEVSCVTVASLLAAVDRDRYEIVPVGIDRAGRWVAATEATGSMVAAGPALQPFEVLTPGKLPLVVLPLLHGPFGEDGTVQGLLELAGVPYVGSGVLGSAVSMDKAVAKELLAFAEVPQVPWLSGRASDLHGAALADRIDAELGWPAFVKPANMGSSIGVSKVHSRLELGDALTLASSFDEHLVIEQGVVGREIECAVLGNEAPEATVFGEILPSHEFYDFDDKYSGNGADLAVPADLPPAVLAEGQALAIRAFQALRCEGLARVDFFYEEGGRGLLVNEVNAIPGFTPFSMYPQLWEASGLPYARLVDRLVALALDRHRRRSRFVGKTRD
jgi:D-alanine-D-alanine ligase